VNYFQILGGITSIGGYGSFLGVGSALTPIQAYSIDTKMDDSFPLTGRVTANSSAYGNLGGGSVPPLETPAAPSNTVCVSSASGSPYNVNASTGGTNTSCSIRWAFQ